MALAEVMPLTVEEIKTFLKVENDLENELLLQLRDTAYQKVEEFIGFDFTTYKPNGDPLDNPYTVPATMHLAVKQIIAYLYEHRGDEGAAEDMPLSAQKLLFPSKMWFGL